MVAPTQIQRRVEWIDFIKGVAIMLVVYGHVVQGAVAAGTMPASKFYQASDIFIYSFHMPVFFIVSGLLSQKLWNVQMGNYLEDKLRTIAWPYAVWFVIGTASALLFPKLYNHTPGSNLLLALARLAWNPGNFWFLHALFFVHVLAAVLSKMPKLTISLISILLFWLSENFANVALQNILHFLLFFVLGLLAGGHMERMATFLKQRAVPGFIVALTLQLAGTLLLPKLYWPIKIVLGISGTAILGFLAMAVSPSSFASVVCRVGSASLGVFLMHPFAQGIVRATLVKGAHLHNPRALVLLQIICATAIPVLFYEKAMSTRLRLLFTLKANPADPTILPSQAVSEPVDSYMRR
jgi:fucose 4-O-acetylase-like acetyltransferase